MRTLSFVISGQKIERDPKCDFSGVVSNSRGYLAAKFRFSEDWMGCKKVAIFSCCGKDYPTPLVDNTCEIPAEALVSNSVQVALVGQRGTYRITTNTVSFHQSVGR